ncbi:Predicted arabinose efflux permease, MFS family [Mesobacillus persicus]|uniref:Predicted arabinose efflux permease, MFS family n=1 Tax=Mesobacillus persicus TaxID=930146 RepID=A0A1H8CUD0_9BACI|nr:MFS transporter [Mesobacillus persicus]SEM98590.1 Predicted arabinose efflux permease, MFS family [Mesobacillus persicus]
MTQEQIGKRNLAIMWFANFFVAGSLTMVMPFLSLYIETFGEFSDEYVKNWSGITFGITFLTAFLFSPVIGRLGDKLGRKRILIFMGFGMALALFLLGYADSVFELFLLRLFMGFFSGFIPVSQAFISTQTKKEVAGKVLGTLQTGSITGSLFGPMIGGLLADSLGYAATFQSTSFFILLSGLLVLTVKEYRIGITGTSRKIYSSKEVWFHIIKNPILLNVMLISILVQVANFSIQPILSLYVAELNGLTNIAFFSGLAFSAAGLGNLLMARKWGALADRIGYIKILVILLLLSAVIYLPGAFVTNIWQLVLIRFALGFTLGGVIPVRVAYIRQEAPIEMQGEVLGYNTSLRFLGNVIGPLLGGFLSGWFGISSVFFITSSLLLLSGLILVSSMQRHPELVKNH